MRNELRRIIIARYQYIYLAAKELSLDYNRLSGLITGRIKPKKHEIKRLCSLLGVDQTTLGF